MLGIGLSYIYTKCYLNISKIDIIVFDIVAI